MNDNNRRVCADIGNFAIKTMTSGTGIKVGQPQVTRSLYAELYEGVSAKRATPDSPLIRYQDRTFHLGSQAYKYSTHQALVLGDKNAADIYIPTLLSTVRASGSYQLRACVPNNRVVLPELKTTFNYELDTGDGWQALKVKFTSVQTVLEGIAAWKLARHLNIAPSVGYTLLLDVGGSTFNALVIDSDGDIVGEPVSLDKSGAIGLAVRLAENGQLKEAIGDEADLSLVLDGLADGTNCYGATGASWEDYLPRATDDWFKHNMQTISTRVKQYLPMVKAFVFAGGSVHHLEGKVQGKPGMHIIPSPQWANVKGLAL